MPLWVISPANFVSIYKCKGVEWIMLYLFEDRRVTYVLKEVSMTYSEYSTVRER